MKIIVRLVFAWSLVFAGTCMATEPPLTNAEILKLEKAGELALRVFDKTGDAAGAAGVMEEAGMRRLLKHGRPAQSELTTYVGLLEDYASLLVRIPARAKEAAPVLKTVIELAPQQVHAMLALGDLYYAQFLQKPDEQYRKIYTAAYQKYVGQLRQQSIPQFLPPHIVDAVYAAGEQEVCAFAQQRLNNNQSHDLFLFFNPATDQQMLIKTTGNTTLPPGEAGEYFASFVAASAGNIRRSQVDIDNEGYPEIHYFSQAGDCQRNLFYQQHADVSQLLNQEDLTAFYETGRVCGASRLAPLHYRRQNYLLEYQKPPTTVATAHIYRVTPERLVELCRLTPSNNFQGTAIESDCQQPVCLKIKKEMEHLIAAKIPTGIEQMTDHTAQVFSPAVLHNSALLPFVNSQHQYLADLNNDGTEELIARIWQKDATGQTHYSHRLFSKQSGAWNVLQLSPALADDTWFYVERMQNQSYIVTYTALQEWVDNQLAGKRYEFRVYRLEGGRLIEIGALQARGS
jgi:hypothetical protein